MWNVFIINVLCINAIEEHLQNLNLWISNSKLFRSFM